MKKNVRLYVIVATFAFGIAWNWKTIANTTHSLLHPSETKPAQSKTPKKGTSMTEIIKKPSGLAYSVITAPKEDAQQPTRGSSVKVHYTGWLADENGDPIMSKKFDSSVDRNQPFEFNVGIGQVIKGWDEAVMDMKIGEKRRLIIPASLGYGDRGAGRLIPGGATLIFDVEVLAIR